MPLLLPPPRPTLICAVRYNRHGDPLVAASHSLKGRKYARGSARDGKALRLKAIVHMTEGHIASHAPTTSAERTSTPCGC